MRFGGHETFAIREGWMHKGLKMLIEDPALLQDEYSADWLGVGRNMAKSIRYWLEATGLADRTITKGSKGKNFWLHETNFGKLVYERDPYFLEPATWWLLHVNLTTSPDRAGAWAWFFNSFTLHRFDRGVCLDSLRRYLQLSKGRMPADNTLRRDISCLLSTYARPIPPAADDPEEARDSPFLELGLLKHFRSSGYYELNQSAKEVPWQVLGYVLTRAFGGVSKGKHFDVSIREASQATGGPGRVFVLTSESLFDMLLRAEGQARYRELELAGLAGERVVRVRNKPELDWVKKYYDQANQKSYQAA